MDRLELAVLMETQERLGFAECLVASGRRES